MNRQTRSNSVTSIPDEDSKLDKLFRKLDMKLDNVSSKLRDELTTCIGDAVNHLEKTITANQKQVNTRIDHLEQHVRDFERINRLKDVIIRGVPYHPPENLWATFGKIANEVRFNFDMNYSVDTVFRLGTSAASSNTSAAILVKFATQKLKHEFMAVYFAHNNLRLNKIGYESDNRIYISDNLSKSNNTILKRAIELKKTGAIEKVATKFGHVLVKWKESNILVKILDIDQLNKN